MVKAEDGDFSITQRGVRWLGEPSLGSWILGGLQPLPHGTAPPALGLSAWGGAQRRACDPGQPLLVAHSPRHGDGWLRGEQGP